MESLEAKFEQLLFRLKNDGLISARSADPIYYLVYPTQDILPVRRNLDVWESRLRNEGWNPLRFSSSECIQRLMMTAQDRELWITSEAGNAFHPDTVREMNGTLSEVFLQADGFEAALRKRIGEAEALPKGMVLLTDLEALHPYFRIGVIEQHLQGQLRIPLVILYPGLGSGQYGLKFLGFYAEDGNYRSVHIGQ